MEKEATMREHGDVPWGWTKIRNKKRERERKRRLEYHARSFYLREPRAPGSCE